ncbi:hypothetical protein SPBR_00459 [Sporothrix brasiliensis 5110]|uniref:Uncharacterized protein n=1 Tax=Sporothrix brasiliensis 5110 TaxID=1398154 RepID=A0A0C2IZ88_9PEZI|nr:uncharacterized protein SPBR_00459 [Sporothrix brasiliensis 5110]KIH90297.1 hypothetical protein SPBR_00459 [Sporothrix brasiliensis 5110]
MPLAQRVARVLPPKQTTPLQFKRQLVGRRRTGSCRTWASATTPRREEAKQPSIFAELFPDEASSSRENRIPDNAEEQVDDKREPQTDGSAIPEDVRQWLENESEAAEGDEDGREADAAPGTNTSAQGKPKKRKTNPTVLVLSGTTPSLLPSDFFRIAPRAAPASSEQNAVGSSRRLVDGWAAGNGGIYKIVQDRDPATLAPRGRYFLYFGSSAAALAYSQEVRELHVLARRAVQQPQRNAASAKRRHKRKQEDQVGFGGGSSMGGGTSGGGNAYASLPGSISSGGSGTGSDAYLATSATPEEVAALRSFSLLAPTAQLDLVMQMPAGSSVGPNATSAITLYDEEELDDVATTTATTKVLVVLEGTSSSGGGGAGRQHRDDDDGWQESVAAGSSSGHGVTTVDGLRALIEADGVRRNLPWAVSDGLNGVVPVQWLVAEQKRLLHEAVKATNARAAAKRRRKKAEAEAEVQAKQNPGPQHPPVALWASRVPDLVTKTHQMNENARFSRFVVAFADSVEARRFVRNWHRRAVSVPGTGGAAAYEQTAIVDTTVLW